MEALLPVKGGLLETNTAVFGSTAVNESTVKMFTAVNGSIVDHKRWSFRNKYSGEWQHC